MTFWLSFLCVLSLDQISKWYVRSSFAIGESVPVLGPWLQLIYRENAGAAFGILPGGRWFFIGISLLSVGFAVFFYPKAYEFGWYSVVALGFVAGGALGNVIDRIHHETVTDFICIRYFPAVFNIADFAIVAGAFLSAITLLVHYQRMN